MEYNIPKFYRKGDVIEKVKEEVLAIKKHDIFEDIGYGLLGIVVYGGILVVIFAIIRFIFNLIF